MPKRRQRGEGSIERLPSGKYRAVVSVPPRPPAKRGRLAFIHKSREQCLRWLRQKAAERDRGQLPDDGGLKLGEWLTDWLATYRTQVEPNTAGPAANHVRHISRRPIAGLRLAAVRPSDVQRFYAALAADGVRPPMARKIATTLRTALREAVRMQYILTDPSAVVRPPKYRPPEMKTWSAEECRQFLDSVRSKRYGPLYTLALDTGMRQGELFGLQWDNLDLDAGRVRVVHSLEEVPGVKHRLKDVKTKASRRLITLSPHCVRVLRRHWRNAGRPKDGKVFCSSNGNWLWKCSFLRWSFDPDVHDANVRQIRFHDLRHTHATLALAAGANLRSVAARLGHADPAFTLKIYAHALPEGDDQIARIWGDIAQTRARDAATQEEE